MSALSNKTRGREPIYPPISIELCLDFIRMLWKMGPDRIRYEDILREMDLKDSASKTFLRRMSAARQYGWLTAQNHLVSLTELGKRVAQADGKPSPKDLMTSFLSPSLYAKLTPRLEGKPAPDPESLRALFVSEYKVGPSMASKAAQDYLANAEYIGFMHKGVLLQIGAVDHEALPPIPPSIPTSSIVQRQEEPLLPAAAVETVSPSMAKEGYHFEIPMLSGQFAQISIPGELTEMDIDFIELYLKNTVPAFLSNLKQKLVNN